jgi:tagatose 1,6-diphosphate aldolase
MVKISAGKLKGLEAVSNKNGVIAAAAMDQRGSLKKSLAKEKGVKPEEITDAMMSEFKTAVTRVLTPYATAILLDPEWGLQAVKARSKNAGVLLSYESTGYDQTQPGRVPQLIQNWTVRKAIEAGADCMKILVYYSSEEKPEVNDIKHAWVERIGAECAHHQIPFFAEFVCYDVLGGKEDTVEFAKKKPHLVSQYMAEYSKPHYNIDVLKIEVPINMKFVEGAAANKTGEVAYSKREARELFHKTAEAAKLPFIYLSAGVSDAEFRESLELAADSGVSYSGVLCGRATWKEGMPVYAKQGLKALEDWLSDRGIKNIQALNEVINRGARPWWDKYGGRDKLQVV